MATKKTNSKKVTTAKKTTAGEKLTALAAAAKVLSEKRKPMNAKEMIEAMAAKKYWISPGGKTPDRTLYAAIVREINKLGKQARFKKSDAGNFTRNK